MAKKKGKKRNKIRLKTKKKIEINGVLNYKEQRIMDKNN